MSHLLSLGTILDRTWETYQKRFVELMSISGWLLIVAILEVLALLLYPYVTELAATATLYTFWESLGVVLFALTNTLIAPVIGVWVYIALVRFLKTEETNNPSTAKALKEGWKWFLPHCWVGILIMAVLLAGTLISFLPAGIIGGLTMIWSAPFFIIFLNLFVILGIFVALILNFRWSVHYLLAPYALLLDGVRGKAALHESRKLVLGRFWQAFIRIVIPKVIFIILGVIIMWALAFVVHILISALVGLNVDLSLRLQSISGGLLSLVIAILINPLVVLADVIVYRNLKETKS
ncbi:TPA: hypothetical protein DEP34_01725 [Candidatus Uhrbacteria bacterium]|uniref:Glycerophosphoryl diester phosphodiesterase membrane domain-containing protein n=2 Tax=Candidatus Uhriibacteriota TaxID=1752732 RepID=A0A0G1Q6I9_9BACT|nr:MAG: hypothetical protein UX45_C0011G0010 [Candidatus Uhrbacteria bacterium GW2011_GWF2_46_218]KKU40661.1 MAG: hypothetical protein UX57_C0012G0010 [Candidatus Uhrbacteria bacterium GW2011_GWE2_46_68]HBK34352.1 hypothetical protein [Candidatus Uhrbacteria bacterium]HCB19088.1 hypothetical protein [Candidatus Uhrbacteria bacterium]